jgi:uncharacterized repeat protein (TIGR01451 family)
MSPASLYRKRFIGFFALFICCLSAFAQTELKEQTNKTDVGAAVQELNQSAQSESGVVLVPDSGTNQQVIRIIPFGRTSTTRTGTGIKSQAAPPGAHLTYFGGPVISNIQVVVVFWGANVAPAITANGAIDQFYTDITASRYFNLLTEYTTAGIVGSDGTSTTKQTIGPGTFGGKFTIAPSVCPGTVACTVTDAQIQAELTRQINAGVLPAQKTDGQGFVNTYYAIYFPPNVTISLAAGVNSCVRNGFCAYHGNTASNIPYGVMPDFSTGGCSAQGACGLGTTLQIATSVSSHEMAEATTDTLVGTANISGVFGPPLGWYDGPTPNLGEIADLCDGTGLADISAGSNTYRVEPLFSNLQNDCVIAPPVFNLTTPASGAGPSIPFNGTLTIQSSVSPFTLTGYTGTVHFTSSDPQAVLPADYTFLGSDAGTHTFSFTLKTLGDQTITATDTRSSGFTGTATVNVNVTPDLTIAKTHTGNFFVGQTGATYTITVSNIGHGPTVGTVTVTDALPTGLTATAISGTGWSCTLGTLTCTRGDALAAGNSYPAITLTVNVATNAPSQVTNTATVSGGGEVNTANSSASDPTTVLAPDLVVSKQHAGAINGAFFQGETGATYTITAINNGNLASIGTVTVVDTLPAAGLTATAISGTGWSCTLGTLTCTRSDALAPNSAYPAITVTVDVALDAPANVVNTATISGGGEVNTGNDVAQDATVILPPPHPDLAPFMNHGFNNFVQGQSAMYRIDITNVGTAITSGAVTVSDTLPTGLTATDMSGVGWTCTVGATSSCTQSTPLQFNNSYAPIFITVSIAANAPASVVNTVTVSGGGDTNPANNSFSDPTSIAAPLVDLTPSVAGSAFEAQGATGVSYTILIGNNGNVPTNGSTITAVTNLSAGITATALSGTGWNCTLSNLTCTRSDALPPFGFFPINVTVDFAKNAPATGSVGETVSGGGDGNAANNTNSEFVNIQPMLGITNLDTTQTIIAGTPAQYRMLVNALTIAGPATMSCSGLPAASTCSFNPPIAPAGVGGSLVVLTINTTAHSGVVPGLRGPGNDRPLLPLLLLMTTALAAFLLRHRLAQQGRRLKPALALTGLLVLAALSGCGGGGPPPPPPVAQGTPVGTYSITVTAASPNATTTSTVTLTVR